MLIEFSVSNYRSFREKQTFSMVAASRLVKKGNVFNPNIKEEKVPALLKVAAIYGPNASGKSNFIRALYFIGELVRRDPIKHSQQLPVSPFRFDPSLVNKPSRFEIHFISQGQRYEYNLGATQERIMEERLIAFPKGKETLLYERLYKPTGEEYVFGEKLEGGSVLHETWRKLTGAKTLFISQAVANSNEELEQLRIPFSWFNNNLRGISPDLERLAQISLSIGSAFHELQMGELVSSFLQETDIPITSIQYEAKDNSEEQIDSNIRERFLDGVRDDETRSFIKSLHNVKATLTHKTALGEAQFDFSEESDGTKNLIGFSLPWLLMGANPASKAVFKTIAIDELDSSLHPKIVACLIEKLLKFEEPAQLIFTTHDTHLMDTKLLRRDQLWLTERDMNGATQLHSIHDFDGRESEDVEKRYYEGRYRGLPILRKG
jgi:AAA15 family ATPase/GTPase